MKKVDLLSLLAENYQKVEAPEEAYGSTPEKEQFEAEGVAFYKVNVYKIKGGVGERITIYFYVKDEGEAGEEAFFRGDIEPYKDLDPHPYRDMVTNLIDEKIGSKEILRGVVLEADEKAEFALVRAFVLEGGVAVEKRYFVYEDDKETIQFILASPILIT